VHLERVEARACSSGRAARECKRLRLDYLQFLELELFTRFGTRLEPELAFVGGSVQQDGPMAMTGRR